MTQQGKYRRWYRALIRGALATPPTNNARTEIHHIRPKCMGGTDTARNLIRLTPRQHILAHDLLARAYGHRWPALWVAANLMHRMSRKIGIRIPSRIALVAREGAVLHMAEVGRSPENLARLVQHNQSEKQRARVSGAQAGKTVSGETRAKLSSALRGRTISSEGRANMAEALKGRPVSAETRAKIAASLQGRKRPPEVVEKISAALRGRTFSEERCEKMRQRSHSTETRKKMSQAHLARIAKGASL